jgi:hypothetical protein
MLTLSAEHSRKKNNMSTQVMASEVETGDLLHRYSFRFPVVGIERKRLFNRETVCIAYQHEHHGKCFVCYLPGAMVTISKGAACGS